MTRCRARWRGLRSAWHRWGCIGLAAVLGVIFQPAAAADTLKEYDVKAALLYNFTQFIEWPAAAFAKADDPLVIGIIGKNPFGVTLESLVAHEHAVGHRIVVQQCRTMAEAGRCHLLFVSSTERDELPQILEGLRGQPILTVAEFDGFIAKGGMVRLYRNSEHKIRMRINPDAVHAAGLSISSKLLRVAEVIQHKEP